MEKQHALGMIGLGVMGRSLALNFVRNGYPVIGYRQPPRTTDGFGFAVTHSLIEFASALETPRGESRMLSALKAERVAAAQVLGQAATYTGDRLRLIAAAEQALYAAKVTSYAQGFKRLKAAAQEYDWGLDFAAIPKVWRAGCIIRAALLGDIAAAFVRQPELPNLLVDPAFGEAVLARQAAWRTVLQTAIDLGIPMLSTGAALAYFDAYRSATLPANLTQAQRDYFGAHTYRRLDRPGSFHTSWE